MSSEPAGILLSAGHAQRASTLGDLQSPFPIARDQEPSAHTLIRLALPDYARRSRIA